MVSSLIFECFVPPAYPSYTRKTPRYKGLILSKCCFRWTLTLLIQEKFISLQVLHLYSFFIRLFPSHSSFSAFHVVLVSICGLSSVSERKKMWGSFMHYSNPCTLILNYYICVYLSVRLSDCLYP